MHDLDNRAKKDKKVVSNQKELFGVFLVTLAVFMFLTLYGLNMGSLGAFTAKFLKYFLGKAAIIFPTFLFYLGINYAVRHQGLTINRFFFSSILFDTFLISFICVLYDPNIFETLKDINLLTFSLLNTQEIILGSSDFFTK